MIFFKVFIILLVSAPIVCGAGDRVAVDTGLPVDPPIIGGPCAPNPCLNDARCVPASETDSKYFCQCSIGFYGANCNETDVALTLALIHIGNETSPTAFEAVTQEDPICVANPCQNMGKCIPDTSVDTGYICLCSMGWAGQNCEETEEGSTRHLRVLPFEEDDSESRMLQSGNTQWACLKNGYAVDYVSIWWGHTSGAGQWACNSWISFCGGQCKASALKLTESNWYCYGVDPMIYVGQAKIWWGHSKGDATWACNNWNANCKKYGGCVAKNVWYSDSQTRYDTFIKCSGIGGACNVINGITLNRFDSDGTDEKVWGCGGNFYLSGASLSGTLAKEPSAEIGLSFSQSDSFYGWEGCCSVAGEALQSRGYLSDGWFCEKDFFSTGIWLKGKAYWL
jgi:EGF-like domain